MEEQEILANLYDRTPEAIEDDDRIGEVEALAALQTFRRRVFAQGKSQVVVATVTTVPSDKQLIVDFVTAEIRVEDPSDLTGAYLYSRWPIQHFLVPTKVYNHYPSKTGSPMDRWFISQPTGLVAEPGEKIRVVASKSNVFGNMQVTFTLFGRYRGL